MIGLCSRCGKEDRYYAPSKKLCASCYSSILQHKKTISGGFSEDYRVKKKKYFREYYAKNKKSIKEKNYSRKSYQINKHKWHTRNLTNAILRKKIINKCGDACILCKSKRNIELHHKIYDYDIIKKSLSKSILVVCRDCHRKLHRLSEVKR